MSAPLTLQRGAHSDTHAQSLDGSPFLCHVSESSHSSLLDFGWLLRVVKLELLLRDGATDALGGANAKRGGKNEATDVHD